MKSAAREGDNDPTTASGSTSVMPQTVTPHTDRNAQARTIAAVSEQQRPPQRRGRLIPIGRFFGVPIYFAPSWLIIAALLTIYYAPVVSDAVPGVSGSTAYGLSLAYACAFAVCVLIHELGHTAVALALRTRVTRVVIFLLGGVSELERDAKTAREEFLVSAAGPFATVLLAVVFWFTTELTEAHTLPGVFLRLMLWSNVTVAIFNLLPALPLDGGRVLRSGVWAVTKNQSLGTVVGAWAGRVLAVVIAIGGLVLDRSVFGYTAGLLSLAMAAYLWVGASATLKYAQVQRRLPTLELEKLLRPGLMVPSDVSVAEALRRAWEGQARGLVLVDSSDRPQAIVDESQVGAVPLERRAWTPVTAVARRLETGMTLPRGLDGEALLDAVRRTPAHEYLVVNPDGSPAGILATADLAAALNPATAEGHR